jgi:hypothetical protein
VAEVLAAHGLAAAFVGAETAHMSTITRAPSRNRSVVGIMNEFTFLVGHAQDENLLALALRLARTPCSPLYRRHVSPDRELHALAMGSTPG